MKRAVALLMSLAALTGCAADQFYEAGKSWESSQPLAALEYYSLCLETDPQHELARQAIGSVDFVGPLVARANAFQEDGNYPAALGVYDQLVEVDSLLKSCRVPGLSFDIERKRREVIELAAGQRFREGEQFRQQGLAKEASKAYRQSLAYNPNNARALALYNEQKATATQRVAILPFECDQAEFKNMARQLADGMISQAIKGQPEFLQFVDRNHLDDLLDEHDLNASGIVDPDSVARTGKLLGLHAMTYGTLKVGLADTGWQEEQYENTAILRHKDKKTGVVTEEEVYARWVVFRRTCTGSLTTGYQVISVETGAILATEHDLTRSAEDSVTYARLLEGRIEAVPGDVHALLDAEQREPEAPNLLVQRIVPALANQLAQKMLRQFR